MSDIEAPNFKIGEEQVEIIPPKIIAFGYEVGEELKIRWQGGLQFGTRQIISPHTIDERNQTNYHPKRFGPWTWYNWRFRRVEGPEQRMPPTLVMNWQESEPDITRVGVQIGKELVGEQKLNMDHPLKPRQAKDPRIM